MASDLGLDRSGNNHHFLVSNMTFDDQVVDSPSNNFASLNSSSGVSSATGTIALSEGNLRVVCPVSGNGNIFSNIGVSSGKWYAEFYLEASTGAMRATVAVSSDPELTRQSNYNIGHLSGARDVGYMGNDGEKFVNNSESSYGTAFSNGDIIGCALDVDNDTVNFNNNGGSWKGTISIASNGTWHIGCGDVSGGYGETIVANFGQDSSFAGGKTAQGNQDNNSIGDFYYTPPSGFLALCTSNLPDVAVTPSEHFSTVAWTGDGTDDRSITGVGFQPDFTWIKGRNTTEWHHVYDAVRGANKSIYPNSVYQQETLTDTFESFDSDGFTVGYNASYSSVFGNKASTNYLAWNWKANGSGSANTAGSINTTVSVNTDAGFSIIKYPGNVTAGATIGHGLSKAPEFFVVKGLTDDNADNNAGNWQSYHIGLDLASPEDYHINMNGTTVMADSATRWHDTAPTSTLITLGADWEINNGSCNFIAYAFHSVDGFSKMGYYEGNQNADGIFVYTGFRPEFVLIRNTVTAGEGFVIMNNKSDPSNVVGTYITVYPGTLSEQGTAGTASSRSIDFLSNGFKLRGNSTEINESGDKHIYIAFAETPFKYANAR